MLKPFMHSCSFHQCYCTYFFHSHSCIKFYSLPLIIVRLIMTVYNSDSAWLNSVISAFFICSWLYFRSTWFFCCNTMSLQSSYYVILQSVKSHTSFIMSYCWLFVMNHYVFCTLIFSFYKSCIPVFRVRTAHAWRIRAFELWTYQAMTYMMGRAPGSRTSP